jgi:UDP-N-acetylmuramate-alanine ligase
MIASNSDFERISFPTRLCEAGMQGVQGLHKAGYGTPVTLIGVEAAAEAADALQAAYFRRSLCAERAQLLAEICKRGDNIAKTDRQGSASVTHRLGSYVRSAEAQVRYLDRLIARLDHRFAIQPDGD